MKQYEKGLILYKECVRITKKHGEKDDLYSVALDMVGYDIFSFLVKLAYFIFTVPFRSFLGELLRDNGKLQTRNRVLQRLSASYRGVER